MKLNCIQIGMLSLLLTVSTVTMNLNLQARKYLLESNRLSN